MYSISNNRRLYISKKGRYRRIRSDDVFEEQTVSVYEYKPRDYIEKVIEFIQGSGSYEFVNCQQRMELICQALKNNNPFINANGYILSEGNW